MTDPGNERGQAALVRAATVAAEALPEAQVLSQLAHCVREGIGADFCAVYLAMAAHTVGRGPWRLEGWSGGDPHVLSMIPAGYGDGSGLLARLFQGGREVRDDDLLAGAHAQAPLPPNFPARSLLGAPLRRRDGRAIGAVIAAATRPGQFAEADVAVFRAIAHLAAIAVDNARLAAAQQRERRTAAESAVTLGTVLESVGSGVCVIDLDGTIRLANRALLDLFGLEGRPNGLSLEAALARAATPPRDLEAFLHRLRELVREPWVVDESEWELGTDPPRIVQRHAAPMRNALGEIVGRVEVYADVTEGRRLYTQLLQSERLRAIGEMASGIAHDFNNLLATIVGQTELLHPDEQSPATRQSIATIRQAALDGARMVRNMQDYARAHQERSSTSANLPATVRAAVELARPRWAGAAVRGGGEIEVRLDLGRPDREGPYVAMDPAELREVLLNLLFNAADAMPHGGRMEIRTRTQQHGWAELVVRDTGHGMEDAVRERIFEPFFTTKGARGSGLGLAVTYSILTRLGGNIRVDSTIGQGTTFTLRIPLAEGWRTEAAEDGPVGVAGPASRRLAGRRVLVVDDEAGLVAVVRQLLERSGARVQTAIGGRAALAVVRDPSARFDAVLTDLDMPDVDGWAVVAAVKARFPTCPVVMLTGWAGEISPDEFKRRGIDAVLAKPSRRAELEATIGDLLAPPPGSAPAALRRILLAEDDAVFAGSLRELLALQGHDVRVAGSAAAALDALDQARFDVVLADYRLGDMTGSELAERIARRPEAPTVVLLTGYATEVNDPTLLGQGISAVLPKPCRAEDLRAVLASVGAHPAPPG